MDSDRIEREIVVPAPIERVWTVLTEPEHIAAWYAFDGAEVDPRPGGAMLFRWIEHGSFHARIEEVDPPSFLSYRFAILAPDEQPRPGNSTLVAFTLRQEDDGTHVRVVESDVASLAASNADKARHIADSGQAWTAGLGLLRDRATSTVATGQE